MKRTLIIGVAFALAPAFALAADNTKKMGDRPASSLSSPNDFRALDKNRDGFLSQDELKAQNLPFATLDKDGDGKISAQEWADHQKGAAGPTGPAGAPGAAGTSSPPSVSSGTPPTSSDTTSTPSTTLPGSGAAPSTSPPASAAPSPTPAEPKKN